MEIALTSIRHRGEVQVRTTVYTSGVVTTRTRREGEEWAPPRTWPAWWGRVRYCCAVRDARRAATR